EALRAGVDVLVEKPIASTLEEARAMNEAAATSDRLLQVGHVERFNGAVLALTEHITRPLFIECHRLSPFPGRGDDVSVVLDLMIHDLDVVLALTKAKVTSLDAVGVPVFSTQEDIANVRLRFDSGCVANLTASRISVESMRKIRIFEENAYVSTDYSEKEVIVYHKKSGEIPENLSPMEWINIEPLEVSREEPLRLELASFIDCVRERRTPVVSGEDGLRALELAFDILAFIREKQ
ncbi:MAG: Gfo/Idh/MocA family oxidoreductase, partial [Candidatus Hydrogenedentes bacterium]|nr:Gfo/Idh/MocA family oxidoreductase [Candidatus Hydrogenedentota bacterium]